MDDLIGEMPMLLRTKNLGHDVGNLIVCASILNRNNAIADLLTHIVKADWARPRRTAIFARVPGPFFLFCSLRRVPLQEETPRRPRVTL